MFSNLKIGVARKKMAVAVKKSYFGSGDEVQRIGVLLDSENESLRHHFLALKEELGLRDNHFKVVICDDEKKEDLYQGLTFGLKDLSWNGKIRNGEIQSFIQQEIDILISFTKTDNKLAALLATVASAKFKVGRWEEPDSSEIFDLVISAGLEEVEIFLTELTKYLKILK
jgi:hypothetical protein